MIDSQEAGAIRVSKDAYGISAHERGTSITLG